MKIVKRKKKKPLLGGEAKRFSESEHWLLFEKGELRGRTQNPEWLELYLLLWFYQHAQRHGSREVAPEVVIQALQVKAPPQEELRRLYREIQVEHARKLVSFQKSWALVKKGVLPKNAHFLYLWLHRYADEAGRLSLSWEEIVLRTRLPQHLVSYALAVLERLRLIERLDLKSSEKKRIENETTLADEGVMEVANDSSAKKVHPQVNEESLGNTEDIEEEERREMGALFEQSALLEKKSPPQNERGGDLVISLAKSRVPWC